MTQKNKLRIGIVGAGGIVKTRHLPALKKSPDVDIVAVSNSTYESSEQFCKARMWMDLAEAEEMLAVSKRFPELMTMLCPPPYGMRADLLIKKLLAENFIGKPHDVRMQSFNGQYLNPE